MRAVLETGKRLAGSCDKIFTYIEVDQERDPDARWIYDSIMTHELVHHSRGFDTESGLLIQLFNVLARVTREPDERAYFFRLTEALEDVTEIVEEALATYLQVLHTNDKYPSTHLQLRLDDAYNKYLKHFEFLDKKNIFGLPRYTFAQKTQYATEISIWAMNIGIVYAITTEDCLRDFCWEEYLARENPDFRFLNFLSSQPGPSELKKLSASISKQQSTFERCFPELLSRLDCFSEPVRSKASSIKRSLQTSPRTTSSYDLSEMVRDNVILRYPPMSLLFVDYSAIQQITPSNTGFLIICKANDTDIPPEASGYFMQLRGNLIFYLDEDYFFLKHWRKKGSYDLVGSMLANDIGIPCCIKNVPEEEYFKYFVTPRTVTSLSADQSDLLAVPPALLTGNNRLILKINYTLYQIKTLILPTLNSYGKYSYSFLTPRNFNGISYLFLQREGEGVFIVNPFFNEKPPGDDGYNESTSIGSLIAYSALNFPNLTHWEDQYDFHYVEMETLRRGVMMMDMRRY